MGFLNGTSWFIVGVAIGAGAVLLIQMSNTSSPDSALRAWFNSIPPINTSTPVKEP